MDTGPTGPVQYPRVASVCGNVRSTTPVVVAGHEVGIGDDRHTTVSGVVVLDPLTPNVN